jgi:2-dehydropantoate 2-reductase
MREAVAIIGSGAIGGYLAGALAGAGRDVTLCVRTPFDRLTVEQGGTVREVPVRLATDPGAVRPTRWVLLTTKAQDTAGAAPWLSALAGSDTVVVAVQNGVDHRARVEPVAAGAAVMPAVIWCSVERTHPGRIVHYSNAKLAVQRGPGSAELAELFAGSGFEVAQEEDLLTVAWRKLLSNLVVNPLTALTLRRSRIFAQPELAGLMRAVLEEAVRVAAAEGAKLGPADIEAALRGFARLRPESGTSMLYDRLAGRPLEHAHLTGALVAAADRHGLAVPVNRTLLALLAAASGHRLDGTD